jgi:hypothetical protein
MGASTGRFIANISNIIVFRKILYLPDSTKLPVHFTLITCKIGCFGIAKNN